jgi:hypothetical protein
MAQRRDSHERTARIAKVLHTPAIAEALQQTKTAAAAAGRVTRRASSYLSPHSGSQRLFIDVVRMRFADAGAFGVVP